MNEVRLQTETTKNKQRWRKTHTSADRSTPTEYKTHGGIEGSTTRYNLNNVKVLNIIVVVSVLKHGWIKVMNTAQKNGR